MVRLPHGQQASRARYHGRRNHGRRRAPPCMKCKGCNVRGHALHEMRGTICCGRFRTDRGLSPASPKHRGNTRAQRFAVGSRIVRRRCRIAMPMEGPRRGSPGRAPARRDAGVASRGARRPAMRDRRPDGDQSRPDGEQKRPAPKDRPDFSHRERETPPPCATAPAKHRDQHEIVTAAAPAPETATAKATASEPARWSPPGRRASGPSRGAASASARWSPPTASGPRCRRSGRRC